MIYYAFRTKRLKFMFVSGFVLTILLLLLPQSPILRLLEPGTGDKASVNSRTGILRAGLAMIKQHPVTGVGLALFKPLTQVYEPTLTESKIAHNTYVEVAAEMGLPALAVFVSIFFISFRRARRMTKYFRKNKEPLGEQIGISLETGIIAACAASVKRIFLSQ